MRIRGERECRDCGRRWSYFETGSVECPTCGSLHSVGTGDREAHTNAPVELELHEHQDRFSDPPATLPSEGVTELKRDLRAYIHKRGFVHAGELTKLDATYLVARELLEAVDVYDRLRRPTDEDHAYLLELLVGADSGDQPHSSEVPSAMRSARGMATALAVETYREELSTYLTESTVQFSASTDPTVSSGSSGPSGPSGSSGSSRDHTGSETVASSPSHKNNRSRRTQLNRLRERLRDRTNQIAALEGDVAPAVADELVRATRAIHAAITTDDKDALDRAARHLDDATPRGE